MSADGFDQQEPDRENPGQHVNDQQGNGQQPERGDEPQKNADANPEKDAGAGRPPEQSETEATRHLQEETKEPFPAHGKDAPAQGPDGPNAPDGPSHGSPQHTAEQLANWFKGATLVTGLVVADLSGATHAVGLDNHAAPPHGTDHTIAATGPEQRSSDEPPVLRLSDGTELRIGAKPEDNPADTEGGDAEATKDLEAWQAMDEQDQESREQDTPTVPGRPPYEDTPGEDSPDNHDGLNREMRRDAHGRTLAEAREESGQWFRGQRPR